MYNYVRNQTNGVKEWSHGDERAAEGMTETEIESAFIEEQ